MAIYEGSVKVFEKKEEECEAGLMEGKSGHLPGVCCRAKCGIWDLDQT